MANTKFDNRRAQLRAQQHAEAIKKRNRKIVITVISILVALIVIAGIGFGVWQYRKSQEPAAIPPNATEKADGIVANPGAASADAPLVEIWYDYQCPACKNFEDSLGSTIQEMARAGEINLTYHTMTFLDQNLRNDSSAKAANAAFCADEVGKFNEYHLAVFQNQPQEGMGYTDEQLRDQFAQMAGITGADLTTFQTCVDEGRYAEYAEKTNRAAGQAGVTGTPTARVDGEDLDLQTVTDPQSFRDAVLN